MITKFPRMVAHQQRALAAIRIFVGLMTLWLVFQKLDPKWVGSFGSVLESSARLTPFSFYASFLNEMVIPMGSGAAYMLMLAELAAGLGLVLGLFTGPAALIGAAVSLNYFFALAGLKGLYVATTLTYFMIQVALAFAHAGTTWGLDRFMVGKMPWWVTGVLHHETREF